MTTREHSFAARQGPDADRTRLIAELCRDFSHRGLRLRRLRRSLHQISAIVFLRTLGLLKKCMDCIGAIVLLFVLAPVLSALYVAARLYGGGIGRRERLGRWATTFPQYVYEWGRMPAGAALRRSRMTHLPGLLNIFLGQMSFIGPRPLSLQEISARDRSDWRRFDIRPGFICLWWIRKRANIAYVCESVMDAEYVETHSFRGDLGIAFRAIPAFAAGHGVLHAPKRINLLGIAIDNLTMKEAADTIGSQASGQQARQICFVNADCVNIAHGNTEYRAVVRRASLVLADGIGIRIAGACLNQHIRQNVNGTDLLPFLCERLERDNLGVYLLGGRPGVAKATAARLRQQHARLKICGHHHGYFTEVEESRIIEDIRNSGARVLLVAMGAPRQELWIGRHLDRLGVSVALGVGGLFDFYSGRIPRAPLWMRELSLEWLYRFVKEPGRMWKRYLLGNPLFLFRMACSRLLRDGDSWEVIE